MAKGRIEAIGTCVLHLLRIFNDSHGVEWSGVAWRGVEWSGVEWHAPIPAQPSPPTA